MFLKREIGFTDIQDIIAKVMNDYPADSATDLEAVLEADRWARARAAEYAADIQAANSSSTEEMPNNTTDKTNSTNTTTMKGGKKEC